MGNVLTNGDVKTSHLTEVSPKRSERSLSTGELLAANANRQPDGSRLLRQSYGQNAGLLNQFESRMATANRALLRMQSTAASMSSSLDLKHVLKAYTHGITNMIGADASAVYNWNSQDEFLSLIALHPEPEVNQSSSQGEVYRTREYPYMQQVMRERCALQVHAERSQTNPRALAQLGANGLKSLLILPMVFQDRVVGLTEVMKFGQARVFSDLELSLAHLLANLAASTVANVQLYGRLVEANEFLKTSNSELDAFAHTVAHDLKGPLANIMGFSEILQNEQSDLSPDELKEYLGYIGSSAYKMQNIIDSVLLFASIRRQEVETEPVDMQKVIAEAQSNQAYLIEQHHAQISTQANWPWSLGYAPWVERVWMNLLSNAVKYGGIPPKIALGATSLNNGMVRFWIKDNGRGLSPKEQATLFRPFARLNKLSATGHGLGLSIARRIVDKLGGELGVKSEVGQGSIFYFTLPACK